jgi:hypothetical protein
MAHYDANVLYHIVSATQLPSPPLGACDRRVARTPGSAALDPGLLKE